MPLIQLCLIRNPFRRLRRRRAISGASSAVGELLRQRRPLFEEPQTRPEGRLQLLRFLTEEHFRSKGMTDMTTEPQHRSLRTLPEHPATIRTGKQRRLLGPLITGLLHEILGDDRLQPLLGVDRVHHAVLSLRYDDGLPDEGGERRGY